MIFHNSIPGSFTVMHNIIEIVAWSYATIFCLSVGLMHSGENSCHFVYLSQMIYGLWHGFAPQHPECLAGPTSIISVSFTRSIK
jgi:hypothetical protein